MGGNDGTVISSHIRTAETLLRVSNLEKMWDWGGTIVSCRSVVGLGRGKIVSCKSVLQLYLFFLFKEIKPRAHTYRTQLLENLLVITSKDKIGIEKALQNFVDLAADVRLNLYPLLCSY